MKGIENAEKNPKEIANWIARIEDRGLFAVFASDRDMSACDKAAVSERHCGPRIALVFLTCREYKYIVYGSFGFISTTIGDRFGDHEEAGFQMLGLLRFPMSREAHV